MKLKLTRVITKEGFALPTVLIASVVMLIVLMSAISASASIRSAIDSQYYNQLGREAVESGLALATECLKINPALTWSEASPLRPGSSCNGSATENGYVIDTPQIKTSFEVASSAADSNGRTQINAKGTVSLRKTSAPTATSRTFEQSTRRIMEFVPKFANLSGNDSHTCALASSQVWCWGNNSYGQLGNNTTTSSLTPTPVKYVNGLQAGTITKVGTGNAHTCALSQAQVWCWGAGSDGQLGIGTAPASVTVPTKITAFNGLTVQDLSVGAYGACAVVNSRVYCWGWSPDGQVGDGTTTDKLDPTKLPTAAPGGTKNAVAVSTTDYHSCMVASDGTAYCWGRGVSGQLGNNLNTNSLYPVQVYTTGTLAKEIGTGSHHTCMLANPNSTPTVSRVFCWGQNGQGQLGYNDQVNRAQSGGLITGGLGANSVTSLSVGDYHTCAIALSRAYCWGRNYDGPGQLGDNTQTSRLQPTAVYTGINSSSALYGKTMISISASDFHTCAVDSAKKAYCWGKNNYGQLGDNTTTTSWQAVPVYTANFVPVFTDF